MEGGAVTTRADAVLGLAGEVGARGQGPTFRVAPAYGWNEQTTTWSTEQYSVQMLTCLPPHCIDKERAGASMGLTTLVRVAGEPVRVSTVWSARLDEQRRRQQPVRAVRRTGGATASWARLAPAVDYSLPDALDDASMPSSRAGRRRCRGARYRGEGRRGPAAGWSSAETVGPPHPAVRRHDGSCRPPSAGHP